MHDLPLLLSPPPEIPGTITPALSASFHEERGRVLLGQNVHRLRVSILGTRLNFSESAAANGVFHHDKTVVRQPQDPCDIFGGHGKRIGTQNHGRLAELLEGNAIVHTAR